LPPVGSGHHGVGGGRQGLVVERVGQAYDLDPADDSGGTDPFANVTYAGPVDWICERATIDVAVHTVRRYVDANAVRITRQSHIEQRQVQTHPQQPSLISRHGCRVRPRHIPKLTGPSASTARVA